MMKTMFDYVTNSKAPVALAQRHNNALETIEDGIDDDMHCIIDNYHNGKVIKESVKHIKSLLNDNSLHINYSLRQEVRIPIENIIGDFQNAKEDLAMTKGIPESKLPNGALNGLVDFNDDVGTLMYWVKKYESNPDSQGLLINL